MSHRRSQRAAPVAAIAVLSLACCLSCSVRDPQPGLERTHPAPVALEVGAPADPAQVRDEALIAALVERFHGYQSGLAPFEISRTAEAIVTEARRYDLDVELVAAVIRTESAYHNFARSPVGALGLMQLMPATGQMLAAELDLPWRGPDTLFDPVVNVKLGTRYLSYLHERYGTWRGALSAYNWGPGKIDRRLRAGDGLPRIYADKVMGFRRSAALL